MTVEIDTALATDYTATRKMSRVGGPSARLPFQPRSVNTVSTNSSSSSDDYLSKGTRSSNEGSQRAGTSRGRGHQRTSSSGSGVIRNEFDLIASTGPMAPSSLHERPHRSSSAKRSSRPGLARSTSAPEHVLRQSLDPFSFSSKKNLDDDIIEEKRRKSKLEEGYTIHRYRRGKLLGKGGFAKVYLCTALDTNKNYAIKIVPKANLVKARARQKVSNHPELLSVYACCIRLFMLTSFSPLCSLCSFKRRSRFIAL